MRLDRDRPSLRAEAISRRFGAANVLKDVSFSLCAGTITILTGPNGSGKSTLINCLSGFDRHYQGQVSLFGTAVNHYSADHRARLGLVRTFQYPHLFSSLTVEDHLVLGRRAGAAAVGCYFEFGWRNGMSDESLLATALVDVHGHRGNELSFGEMKLVNTARAFMSGAKVLLLDEPLASLHGSKRDQMLESICKKRDEGCAVLVIEHDFQELSPVANAIYELRDGHLAQK